MTQLTDKLSARLRERWHACTHSHHRLGGMSDCPLCSIDEKLLAVVSAAELFASFAPKGPVPEGLSPEFYHTLDYEEEVKLQARIDAGRAALAALESECGE